MFRYVCRCHRYRWCVSGMVSGVPRGTSRDLKSTQLEKKLIALARHNTIYRAPFTSPGTHSDVQCDTLLSESAVATVSVRHSWLSWRVRLSWLSVSVSARWSTLLLACDAPLAVEAAPPHISQSSPCLPGLGHFFIRRLPPQLAHQLIANTHRERSERSALMTEAGGPERHVTVGTVQLL